MPDRTIGPPSPAGPPEPAAPTPVTPLSQLFNILVFACVSLSAPGFSAVVYQGAGVLFSLFLLRGRLRGAKARSVLPLLPVLGFVFAVNSFRGSGEVVARIGVFVLVRQGVVRGTYYSCVIALLFVMSRLLTKGFSRGDLFDSLYTLSRAFGRRAGRHRGFPEPAGGGRFEGNPDGAERSAEATPAAGGAFLLVLFFVLEMFQIAYAEMKGFFGKEERSLKRKLIAYFRSVYEKSMSEFALMDAGKWRAVRPLPLDFVSSALQVCLMGAAVAFRLPLPWSAIPD